VLIARDAELLQRHELLAIERGLGAEAQMTDESRSSQGKLRLLVIGERSVATHWLPESGEVRLGQAEDSDIVIDEPSVSSAHAVLHMGEQIFLEDLGSAHGTHVNAKMLPIGERVLLNPGEQISIGSVLVVVQKKEHTQTPRRIWTHGYFESRLEEECLRAERSQTGFSVLRVRCGHQADVRLVEQVLANVLRILDIVGVYGPEEYEVLLVETPPSGAELVVDRLKKKLHEAGMNAMVGMACYPRDGRSPDALSAKAGAGARGEVVEPPIQESVEASPAMQNVHQLVERVANGIISVLIQGETGVGKERLAEMVHRFSPRNKGPFLRLNCAALSETLLESELFGHERGSFTGAVQAKQGLLETANGGTVFFDEVGELPMSVQVKLLRVIEEKQVLRVGGLKSRPIDVRFVSATNRDLETEVSRGTFRQDLFFRLNGITLSIPPLRERVSEVEGLARRFITEATKKTNRNQEPSIARDVMDLLKRYGWPGNIRELRNVVERAVLVCNDDILQLTHFPVERMSASFAPRLVAPPPPRQQLSRPATFNVPPPQQRPSNVVSMEPSYSSSAMALATGFSDPNANMPLRAEVRRQAADFERQRILEALAKCAGNQTEAAKLLGISRRTLVNRLNLYEIARPRKGRRRAEES
jgi:two-component system response regulator AtoC